MQLSIGFSPCPNDTYIFDALIHNRINNEGLEFDLYMEDVEALNQKAFEGLLDITKLSYHAFAYLSDKYQLLDAGSALGYKCGPLLIAKRSMTPEQILNARIGIPGKYTTANFLLSIAFPEAANKVEMVFSDIETALLKEQIDVGLIIHENRFTYEDKGLVKLIDLGAFWETLTAMPIPLGGIVVKRSLPENVKQTINRLIRESILFAKHHEELSIDFIRQHAQEMEESVMWQHIRLYVNHFSEDLGLQGKAAITKMFTLGMEKGIIPPTPLNQLFLNL